MHRLSFSILISCCAIVNVVLGTPKCVWVRGALQCHRNPEKHQNVEVRVIDRDGWGPLKLIDPDDLMGVTFTEPDGTFQLDGCGNDFNIVPGVENLPDPFVRILHYCNSEKGETLELPEFRTFVPDTYDLGIMVLDDEKHPNVTVTFPVPENPRRRLHQEKRPSVVGITEGAERAEEEAEHAKETVHPTTDEEDTPVVTLVDAPTSTDANETEAKEVPLEPSKPLPKLPNDELFWTAESVELLEPEPAKKERSGSSGSTSEEHGTDAEGRSKNWTKKKLSDDEKE